MIRITADIDRYIMDGKIDHIVLEKDKQVIPVSFDKLNINKETKNIYIKKEKAESGPFDDILKEEIKKRISKR